MRRGQPPQERKQNGSHTVPILILPNGVKRQEKKGWHQWHAMVAHLTLMPRGVALTVPFSNNWSSHGCSSYLLHPQEFHKHNPGWSHSYRYQTFLAPRCLGWAPTPLLGRELWSQDRTRLDCLSSTSPQKTQWREPLGRPVHVMPISFLLCIYLCIYLRKP